VALIERSVDLSRSQEMLPEAFFLGFWLLGISLILKSLFS